MPWCSDHAKFGMDKNINLDLMQAEVHQNIAMLNCSIILARDLWLEQRPNLFFVAHTEFRKLVCLNPLVIMLLAIDKTNR